MRYFRADAASYQAGIINECCAHRIRFAIRAKMDRAVRETVLQIADEQWTAVVDENGAVSEVPVQLKIDLNDERLHEVDSENARRGRYVYRAIATDLHRAGFSDEQIVWWYNQRADASENRLKELRSDFCAAKLLCG